MIAHIINSAAPLLLAAMGGLLTEQAGVLNIALEGMMLGGAFIAILIAGAGGSLPLILLAAAFNGLLWGALFNLTAFRLKGNLFICGLGINILIPAISASLTKMLYGNLGIIRSEKPVLIPRSGPLDFFTLMAIACALALVLYLYKTFPGLALRACGEKPALLKARGIPVVRVQKKSILMSGVLASLGGAALSLRLGVYVPGMSAGRGWMALVAIYLGFRRIPGIFPACLFFAAAEWGAHRAQGLWGIPPGLILSFPYFLTLGGLWFISSGFFTSGRDNSFICRKRSLRKSKKKK